MPAYEYACAQCGDFVALRSIAARNDPLDCPGCGETAARVILTAPAYAGMPAAQRLAHATNERAAHEPRQSSRTDNHGAGCSCCGGAGSKSSTTTAADGSKSFAGRRPWMISH